MAFQDTFHSAPFASVWADFAAFLGRVGEAMCRSAAAEARLKQIDRLTAKSDAELAKMGLGRADIPAYVFRDLMHI